MFRGFETSLFLTILLSQVAHDTLNPVWNQTFDFVVEDGQHEMLILDVYDHDTFGKVTLHSSLSLH